MHKKRLPTTPPDFETVTQRRIYTGAYGNLIPLNIATKMELTEAASISFFSPSTNNYHDMWISRVGMPVPWCPDDVESNRTGGDKSTSKSANQRTDTLTFEYIGYRGGVSGSVIGLSNTKSSGGV